MIKNDTIFYFFWFFWYRSPPTVSTNSPTPDLRIGKATVNPQGFTRSILFQDLLPAQPLPKTNYPNRMRKPKTGKHVCKLRNNNTLSEKSEGAFQMKCSLAFLTHGNDNRTTGTAWLKTSRGPDTAHKPSPKQTSREEDKTPLPLYVRKNASWPGYFASRKTSATGIPLLRPRVFRKGQTKRKRYK